MSHLKPPPPPPSIRGLYSGLKPFFTLTRACFSRALRTLSLLLSALKRCLESEDWCDSTLPSPVLVTLAHQVILPLLDLLLSLPPPASSPRPSTRPCHTWPGASAWPPPSSPSYFGTGQDSSCRPPRLQLAPASLATAGI